MQNKKLTAELNSLLGFEISSRDLKKSEWIVIDIAAIICVVVWTTKGEYQATIIATTWK